MGGFGGIFPLWGRLLGIFVLLWVLTQHRIKRIILQTIEGEVSKKQLMFYAAKRIIFVIIAIIAITFWHQYTHRRFLQKLYAIFLPESTTKKVRLIDGNYFSWMDWHASLIFSTDQDTFNSIVEDYEIIPKENIIGRYFKDTVMKDPTVIFYYKDVPIRDKRCEEYLIAWDKKEKTAYFHGNNSSYFEILVAKVDIPKGTVVSQDMVEMKYTTFTKLGKGAILDNANAPTGKVATKDILGRHETRSFKQ